MLDTRRYLRAGGVHCPDTSCLSPDIEGGHIEVEAGYAYQPMSCNACGLEWEDQYRLVGILGEDGEDIDPYLPDEDEDELPDEDVLEDYDLMSDLQRAAVLRDLYAGVA